MRNILVLTLGAVAAESHSLDMFNIQNFMTIDIAISGRPGFERDFLPSSTGSRYGAT